MQQRERSSATYVVSDTWVSLDAARRLQFTPAMDDVKINGIIRNQKRLMAYNLLISALLGCGLIASVLALA